jgi:hypothetical protein
MTKFTDNLWSDLMEEHGHTLDNTDPQPPRRRRRPRVLAASTLGLAGIGAGLVLALSGTAATSPALAVTKSSDGSVLVKLDYAQNQNLPQVNAKLAAMGTNEGITIYMAKGPDRPGRPLGADRQGSHGHERHRDDQAGRVGRQHGRGHVPPGPLRGLERQLHRQHRRRQLIP